MERTSISWTDNSFNGWIGCTKVSPGCAHCYAETMNKRCGGHNWGAGADRRVTSEANWRKPLKWNRESARKGIRTRVFCSSMADVFDAEAPVNARARLFSMIQETPNLDWQLLTKRPENFSTMLPLDWKTGYENTWLGVTVEDRDQANRRIPLLKQTPARIRFLSCEPLLEDLGELDLDGIDWVIVGGESGGGARPFDVLWAERIVARCQNQQVAVFVKQFGADPRVGSKQVVIHSPQGGRDRHAGDPAFWPPECQHLAIRELPKVLQ